MKKVSEFLICAIGSVQRRLFPAKADAIHIKDRNSELSKCIYGIIFLRNICSIDEISVGVSVEASVIASLKTAFKLPTPCLHCS